MLAEAQGVRYVHEPFNPSKQRCACGVRIPYSFWYISSHNDALVRTHVGHSVNGRAGWFDLVNAVHDRRVVGQLRPFLRVAKSFVTTRAVVKDPLAIFATEWLASAFNVQPVVVIRHPAAVVSSYKMLNWSHRFADFLSQPALMQEHLLPFHDDIRAFAAMEHDVVDQAALLWTVIHRVISDYQRLHDDWIFVKYEDVALNPDSKFREMFNRLGLRYSTAVQRAILSHSVTGETPEGQDPYGITRNGRDTVARWKQRLTPCEVKRVRRRVEAVASSFYAEHEW
jgi:hypothetical protein